MGGDPISVARDGLRNEDRACLARCTRASLAAGGLAAVRAGFRFEGGVGVEIAGGYASIGEGVATARQPQPGTQSISALPRRVECDASDGLRAVET